MESQRIDYIDVAKGLCMLLVVWQHTHTYYLEIETGEFYMESFRMPLFFLISGMFFKLYSGFGEFSRRKFNSLIVPFLFFYLVFSVLLPNLLYAVGYSGLREETKLGWHSIFNCIFEKVYSNSTVWFLLALIWLNYLFWGIQYLSQLFFPKRKMIAMLCMAILCGFFGFSLGVFKVPVWANIDNAFTACPFFCLGFLLMRRTNVIVSPPRTTYLIGIILFGALYVYLFSHGLSFKQNKWEVEYLIPLYTCGAFGSFAVIALSKILENSTSLQYFGKNTLILLCMQMPVIQVVNIAVRKLGLSDWPEFLLTFIMVIISFYIVIPIMNNYLPWFVGKKNLI